MKHSIFVLVFLIGGLAACGKTNDVGSSAESPAQETAKPRPEFAIDLPLKAMDIGTTVTRESPTTYNAASQLLSLSFRVANTGSTPLTSNGARPVRLGVQLADEGSDGSIHVLKKDFVRAQLPEIQPNESAVVTVNIPTSLALGHSLKVVPVQEGVAWFDDLGQAPLIVGPVDTCSDGKIGICVE